MSCEPRSMSNVRNPENLSPREQEMVILIAEGFTYKEIACKLNLSTHTVSATVANASRKIFGGGEGGCVKLTRWAVSEGWVSKDWKPEVKSRM